MLAWRSSNDVPYQYCPFLVRVMMSSLRRVTSAGWYQMAITRTTMMAARVAIIACGFVMAAATAARADCLSDFNAINRINAGAGPYEISGRIFIAPTGTAFPDAPQTVTTVQVMPPKSFRIRMRAVDIVVTDTMKGWVKNAGASWAPVPADKLADLLKDAPSKSYFAANGLADLQCRGVLSIEDKPYLTFTYSAVINGRKAVVTAHFDPASRRPVAGESIVDVGGTKARTAMSYRFDRAIRVTPPVP